MRIAFFGTPAFAVPTLDALCRSRHSVVAVVAQPDRPQGRGMRMQKPPVGVRAEESGIPLFQPERIDAAFLDAMRGCNVELGVVVAYGKIVPQSLIDLPVHGLINVHASLLPRWRGAAPVQRSIEAGETETGVTIMRIDRQLDHGPLFATRVLPIGSDERAPSLFARLAAAGGELLVDVVDAMEEGRAVEREQDHEQATYAKKLEKEEGRVRWDDSTRAIYDRFRAFDPWPGTFFEHEGQMIKVHEMSPAASGGEAPGTVLSIDDVVTVATADGALALSVVQRAGKGRMGASEVFRAASIARGTRLS